MGVQYKRQAGFTIIEVTLFLAISGLLLTGLLASTSIGINMQRYKDAVTSFQSLVKQQFYDVQTVHNDRTSGPCSVADDPSASTNRGQSDCEIVGKLLEVKGGNYTYWDVLGYDNSTSADDDLTAIKNMKLAAYDNTKQTGQLEWSTAIAAGTPGVGVGGPSPAAFFSLLVIQSPISGNVYSFSGAKPGSDLLSSIRGSSVNALATLFKTPQAICIDPSGLIVADNMAVTIDASATSASVVNVRANSTADSSGVKGTC